MQLIIESRQASFTLTTQDIEFPAVTIIHGLSEDKCCKTLITTLLTKKSNPTNIAKLHQRLVTEDGSHATNPTLYGLKKTEHGLLLVDTTGSVTEKGNAVSTQSGLKPPPKPKTKWPTCTYPRCGKPHTTKDCYRKQIANLKKLITAAAAPPAAVRFTTADVDTETATTAHAYSLSPSSSDDADDLWIADTSATIHMTPHWAFFVTYELCSTPVRLADGNVVNAAGVGTVAFVPCLGGGMICLL